ncbi:MAG: hypothetical protein ACRD1T_15735, partial [Acidimicrobiia bacterium]
MPAFAPPVQRLVFPLIFFALGILALRSWRRDRNDAARWLALEFALLGALVSAFQLRLFASGSSQIWLTKL